MEPSKGIRYESIWETAPADSVRDVKYILWQQATGKYFTDIVGESVRVTSGLCFARMWKRKKKAAKMAVSLESGGLYFVVRKIEIAPNGDIMLMDPSNANG